MAGIRVGASSTVKDCTVLTNRNEGILIADYCVAMGNHCDANAYGIRGWISLSNAVAYVQTDSLARGPDTDGDGLADPWELQFAPTLATMNGSSDSDGDGAPDLDEYGADTNPMDANDRLRITRFDKQAGQADLSWRSRPTRFYQIQTRPALAPGIPWMNSGLGLQAPDTGNTTRRIVPLTAATEGYIRIEAICPLNP